MCSTLSSIPFTSFFLIMSFLVIFSNFETVSTHRTCCLTTWDKIVPLDIMPLPTPSCIWEWEYVAVWSPFWSLLLTSALVSLWNEKLSLYATCPMSALNQEESLCSEHSRKEKGRANPGNEIKLGWNTEHPSVDDWVPANAKKRFTLYALTFFPHYAPSNLVS